MAKRNCLVDDDPKRGRSAGLGNVRASELGGRLVRGRSAISTHPFIQVWQKVDSNST